MLTSRLGKVELNATSDWRGKQDRISVRKQIDIIWINRMDFSTARNNMVESQIRPNGITEKTLIDALAQVGRENFVPDTLKSTSYADEALKVKEGRYLLSPMVLGRLLQLAEIKHTELVLDVGPATGYSSAIIASMAESVVGIEQDTQLCEQAGDTLLELGVANVAIICGDHDKGVASEAPYDVIVLNGRVSKVPQILFDQLADGGRLVGVVGDQHNAKAVVYTKSKQQISDFVAFDASAPKLWGLDTNKVGFQF